jgi:hypothetical protein
MFYSFCLIVMGFVTGWTAAINFKHYCYNFFILSSIHISNCFLVVALSDAKSIRLPVIFLYK